MDFKIVGNDIVIFNIKNFDIEKTLECGQCFRFEKINDKEYTVVAFNRFLRIEQLEDKIIFYNTTERDFSSIWFHYFDFEKDYEELENLLINKDDILKTAVTLNSGMHILNQDVWECLISFIISQNKNIKHIKQIIAHISEAFGDYIGTFNGKKYFSFPTIEQLSKATEQDIRDCKAGFRAPYIVDACYKIKNKIIDLDNIKKLSTEEARKELIKIKGVGPKIADCVLLFSLERNEVFPVDVWIDRIMKELYVTKDEKKENIREYAFNYFGNYAGLAQQYLFYYARDKKIGK